MSSEEAIRISWSRVLNVASKQHVLPGRASFQHVLLNGHYQILFLWYAVYHAYLEHKLLKLRILPATMSMMGWISSEICQH